MATLFRRERRVLLFFSCEDDLPPIGADIELINTCPVVCSHSELLRFDVHRVDLRLAGFTFLNKCNRPVVG